jgi:hypothetical protein
MLDEDAITILEDAGTNWFLEKGLIYIINFRSCRPWKTIL